MSHFLTFVLVDRSDPDPIARAGQAMTPFWSRDLVDDETGEEFPDSKCDGFVVGGRYDGLIHGKEQHHDLTPQAYQARYGLDVVRPEENISLVANLAPDLVPYAVVTPDGRWDERGRRSEQEWRDVLRPLLTRHAQDIVVAIDCHI